MNLQDLLKERKATYDKADVILSAAERAGRDLTQHESNEVDMAVARVKDLNSQIQQREAKTTLRLLMTDGKLIPGNTNAGGVLAKPQPKTLSSDYVSALFASIKSGGRIASDVLSEGADGIGGYAVPTLSAALREGSNAAGGFATPSMVDQQIVPLASAEMAIRTLASVLPTSMDVKIPIKATKGTAAAKAEGDGTGTNVFGGTAPTLTQKTLTAYMAGDILDISWEALQDISFFQAFATDDIINAVLEYEEPKFISGSGSGEPEGVLTGCDVGTTVTGAHAVQGVITLDSIYDLVATLNEVYHSDAAFLMQRSVGLFIRKLQRQANLFEPVWTRENGKDYLLGYPVAFSQSMPDGSTDQDKPIVFGSFKRGYVIGDRGGSGINVKILDQPKAKEGITQLLAYRRTDGRVRRSEALKALKLATGA
jgi:HK97 family phage major capsid protein